MNRRLRISLTDRFEQPLMRGKETGLAKILWEREDVEGMGAGDGLLPSPIRSSTRRTRKNPLVCPFPSKFVESLPRCHPRAQSQYLVFEPKE